MSVLTLDKITPKQLADNGVQALATRPNRPDQYGKGGMSPLELKLWFDRLSTLIAGKINELQDAIAGDNAAKYIRIMLDKYEITTLDDLVKAITSGKLSTVMQVYPGESAQAMVSIQKAINDLERYVRGSKYVVNFTEFVPDKTYEEIKDAVDGGKVVIGIQTLDGFTNYLFVYDKPNPDIVFRGLKKTPYLYDEIVTVHPDNTVQNSSTPIKAANPSAIVLKGIADTAKGTADTSYDGTEAKSVYVQPKDLIVGVTDTGGGIAPQGVSYADITKAFADAKQVYLQYKGKNYLYSGKEADESYRFNRFDATTETIIETYILFNTGSNLTIGTTVVEGGGSGGGSLLLEIQNEGGDIFSVPYSGSEIANLIRQGTIVELGYDNTLYAFERIDSSSVAYFGNIAFKDGNLKKVVAAVGYDRRVTFTTDEINPESALIVKSGSIPEISDESSFLTYFYNLRKSNFRIYQFELNSSTNQNIINAIGGYPEGITASTSAFLYVELPYSEAGGYAIKCTVMGRNSGYLAHKTYHATLNASWNNTGWIVEGVANALGDSTITPISQAAVKNALASLGTVFKFKGTKATASALPSTGDVGDVWLVTDESLEYVWVQDGGKGRWEQFGTDVDLSGYLQKSEIKDATGTDTETPMSQDATTKAINAVKNDDVASVTHAVVGNTIKTTVKTKGGAEIVSNTVALPSGGSTITVTDNGDGTVNIDIS